METSMRISILCGANEYKCINRQMSDTTDMTFKSELSDFKIYGRSS